MGVSRISEWEERKLGILLSPANCDAIDRGGRGIPVDFGIKVLRKDTKHVKNRTEIGRCNFHPENPVEFSSEKADDLFIVEKTLMYSSGKDPQQREKMTAQKK